MREKKGPKFQRIFPSTSPARSYTMSQIKSHNTKPEIALRKALRKSGLNYRLKNKKLPGRPDIVLPKLKVAIFVDGDFWHGYFFNKKVKRITKNKSYWVRKIQYNMKRDKNNTKELRKIGWTVLRFWEHQIIRDSTRVVSKILERVNKIRSFES